VETEWEVRGRGVEREREEQIKGVRDGAQEKSETAWIEKWPLERTPDNFKSIKEIKCQSKRISIFWVISDLLHYCAVTFVPSMRQHTTKFLSWYFSPTVEQ
jgi:hypothetical protein